MINDKINEDELQFIFQLTAATTYAAEYLYKSYINTQTKQQRGESMLKYVSSAKDQEGFPKQQ